MRFHALPLLLLALPLAARAADDWPPIGPAAGSYVAGIHDPFSSALQTHPLPITLPDEFRITRYRRVRLAIQSDTLVIADAKPKHEKKLRATLADSAPLEKEFFAGLLSSGPLWISAAKPDSAAGLLTAEIRLKRVECGKGMRTYVVVALPVLLPVPVQQNLGALALGITVRDGERVLMRYDEVFLLNLSDPGPKLALRGALHLAGDRLGQVFRGLWAGEKAASMTTPAVSSDSTPPAPVPASPPDAPAALPAAEADPVVPSPDTPSVPPESAPASPR